MLALLSRIPVGFGGLQAGLQGQSGNASAPLPAVCPIRLRGGSAGARRGPVELHVINEHMGNLELLYVAGDTERRYWVIDARGDFRINTREGDVWYLRTKTGTLAAEITVGSDARQKLTIPRCLPEAQLEEAAAASAHDVPTPAVGRLEGCAPWSLLSASEPSPGMHVVCVLPPPEHAPVEAAQLAVYADGWTEGAPQASRPPPSHSLMLPPGVATSVEALALHVMRRLGVAARGPAHQPPGIYLPSGARLSSVAEVLAAPCVLIFEGGLWVWPGVEVGHVLELEVDDGTATRDVRLTTLSLFPRVMLASNFILEEEASLITRRADGHMFKSGVKLKAADAGKQASDYRTSSQWSFPLWEDAILPLDQRVQQLTRIPLTHAEQIQVLRYLPGEHYTAHHDFFDPGEYGGERREQGYAHNRFATVFFYLNQVEAGGATNFPRAGKLEQPRDFLDCTRGLPVRPERLAVLIFYSMLPNGEFDQTSLHAGCDVERGVKWAANFWFWNQPQSGGRVAQRLAHDLRNRSMLRFERQAHP